MSRCCSVCGDNDCRTLDFKGRRYQTVPRELLVRAGLMAASQLLARYVPSSTQRTGVLHRLLQLYRVACATPAATPWSCHLGVAGGRGNAVDGASMGASQTEGSLYQYI